jgi:pimeloyl-ACP methyl ester carboxylesterase
MQTYKVTKSDTRVPAGNSSQELHVHLRSIESNNDRPIVILSHGFSVDGTESHRLFLNIADAYNAVGYNTVQFDYRGCGYSDGDFSDFSLSGAVSDLLAILKWTRHQGGMDHSRIVIHGQSLGTAVAVAALKDDDLISGFVLWNLSANLYTRYLQMLGDYILEDGETCMPEKGFFVRREFLEDLKGYDILQYFDAWKKPVLFVSSGADTKGDARLAESACAKAGKLARRIVVPDANHSFKCQPDLERDAIQASVDWVHELLS